MNGQADLESQSTHEHGEITTYVHKTHRTIFRHSVGLVSARVGLGRLGDPPRSMDDVQMDVRDLRLGEDCSTLRHVGATTSGPVVPNLRYGGSGSLWNAFPTDPESEPESSTSKRQHVHPPGPCYGPPIKVLIRGQCKCR